MKYFYLLLILINLKLQNCVSQFCAPVISNFDPSELPTLPREFETKVVITSTDQNTSSDAVIIYDSFRRKGELVISENGFTFRRVYYFDEDEILLIINDQKCTVSKLSQENDPYFGIVLQTANHFFHFDNQFPIEKREQEMRRGIPVNHYRSCQNWTQLNANYLIDFYFQAPQFKQGLAFDFKEVLIEITMEGNIYNGQNFQTFKRTYSFYEFRSLIEHRQDLFTHPQGIFCENQSFKQKVPVLPKYFSYTMETINKNNHYAVSTRNYYSQDLNAFRIDLVRFNLDDIYDSTPVKVIHDYNSGVGYVINKNIGNCSYYTLNPESIESFEMNLVSSNFGTFLELKNPNQLFGLDDRAFYAGQRYERGMLCDVYIVNKTDFKFPDVKADYFVLEVYILSRNQSEFLGSDQTETYVPISTRITAPGTDFSLINHIYNFDSKFNRKKFDVSDCFSGKHLKKFGIKYNYAPNINREIFDTQYNSRLVEIFDQVILKAFKIFNASPLRILEAKIDSNDNGFIVYSGTHDFAPAIHHFKKFGYAKIDINKAQRAIESNSAKSCAKICLNESVYDVFNYKCLSFDYCPFKDKSHHICSFYNQSLITDPALQVANESAVTCSHYSKIVSKIDGVDVETLLRSVKQSVSNNQFNLEITDQKTIVFSATDLFEYSSLTQSGSTGTSSFFQKFKLVSDSRDFDQSNLELLQNIYLIRSKTGVSIDECCRLCLNEQAYDCQSMSYSSISGECKWSSLDTDIIDVKNTTFIKQLDTYRLFNRDVLYNYFEYPFKITTNFDYKIIEVRSASECASNCNSDTSLNCRSFNLCKNDKLDSFKCLLSEINIHRNANVTNTTDCSHYSKKSLADFLLVPATELKINAKSKLYGVSVEQCAELCVFEDSYLCRSFQHYTNISLCFLFVENLKDEIFIDLKKIQNPNSNYYSRLYYEKNGMVIQIEPLQSFKSGVKYSAGTIFGFLIAIIIASFVLGVILGYAFLRLTEKPVAFPIMKFKNPNYIEQTEQ